MLYLFVSFYFTTCFLFLSEVIITTGMSVVYVMRIKKLMLSFINYSD